MKKKFPRFKYSRGEQTLLMRWILREISYFF